MPPRVHRLPPHALEHYIFPKGGDGIYLSFDRDNKFRQDNFLKAINAIAPASDGYAANKTANRTEGGNGGSDGKCACGPITVCVFVLKLSYTKFAF